MPNDDQNDPQGDPQGGQNGQQEPQGQQQQQAPEWKPPTSQEDLERIIDRRLKTERAKYRDFDSIKERAGLYDQLLASTQTDQERAAAAAEEKAYNAAMGSVVPRMVRAEFRAAAKGLLDDDQLMTLLEDVDLTKYAGDDGEPDLEKIAKKVKALAPKTPPPSFGQGSRGQTPQVKKMDDWIRKQAGVLPA